MERVVQALREGGRKMTNVEIRDATGLTDEQVSLALYALMLRSRVRLSSFEPSKPGGQAGVAMWGPSYRKELWELADDDEVDFAEDAPTPRKGM